MLIEFESSVCMFPLESILEENKMKTIEKRMLFVSVLWKKILFFTYAGVEDTCYFYILVACSCRIKIKLCLLKPRLFYQSLKQNPGMFKKHVCVNYLLLYFLFV